jgi:hypothetical protein
MQKAKGKTEDGIGGFGFEIAGQSRRIGIARNDIMKAFASDAVRYRIRPKGS